MSADLKVALHRFGLHILGNLASMTEAALDGSVSGSKVGEHGGFLGGRMTVLWCPSLTPRTVAERTSLPFSSASLDLTPHHRGHPPRQGFYPVRRYVAATPAEPLFSASWSMALPGPENSLSREALGVESLPFSVIKARMEDDHPQGAVEDVTLTLDNLTGESGVQMGLLPDVRESGRRQLIEVERDLQARTGGRPALYRIVEAVPRHPAPEMRTLRVPIDSSESTDLKPVSGPVAVVVEEGRGRKPVSVRVGNRWRRVASIEEEWGVRPVVDVPTPDSQLLPGQG